MKTVSKSLVAFLVAAGMFAYQMICLLGSGVDESSRILARGGGVVAIYLVIALAKVKRWKDTAGLSVFVSVIVCVWIIASCGFRAAGGNGLFFRDFFSDDVFYCMDVLFHSAIVESLKHYCIPSTLLGGGAMHYHLGAHWLMAGIAKLFGISGMAMIGYLFPLIFIPIALSVLLGIIQGLRGRLGGGQNLSAVDCVVLLILICGVWPCYSPYGFGPFFLGLCRSESFLIGSIFLLVALYIIPLFESVLNGEAKLTKGVLIIFVLIPLLIVSASFSKISSGYTVMALFGGAMLYRVKWRCWRHLLLLGFIGIVYLIIFWCVSSVVREVDTTDYAVSYFQNVYVFFYRALRQPFVFSLSSIPLLLVFLLDEPPKKGLKVPTIVAVVASFLPYVLLKVHGRSELYFVANSYLVGIVYLMAIGLPERMLKVAGEYIGARGKRLLIALLIFFACSSLVDKRAINGWMGSFCRGRYENVVTQSVRYCNLIQAKQFVDVYGRKNVLAYVTKNYWTARTSIENMPKAYIFAIPAYLGIPVIGVIKSDAGNVYVRVSGEWTPLDKPISYGLDKYLRIPVPEYTLESALEYAAQQGRRYLLTFGAGDRVDVYDVQKKSPISFREGIL